MWSKTSGFANTVTTDCAFVFLNMNCMIFACDHSWEVKLMEDWILLIYILVNKICEFKFTGTVLFLIKQSVFQSFDEISDKNMRIKTAVL